MSLLVAALKFENHDAGSIVASVIKRKSNTKLQITFPSYFMFVLHRNGRKMASQFDVEQAIETRNSG